MPKINIFGVIAADEQIQKAIAIVIKPYRCVGVDPGRQSRLLGHAREAMTLIVVK